MEATYKVLGNDGKEYGPVTLAQFKSWIHAGRVNASDRVLRSDRTNWLPAASFGELGLAEPPSVVAAPPTLAPAANVAALQAAAALERQMKSGAGWFYWIAGLSLINSIATLSGSSLGFVIGLGVTRFIDVFANQIAGSGTAVALVLDGLAAGIFISFGVFAARRHTWAFIVGMVLYALDGLLFLLVQDWISVGFHGFALFFIFGGMRAALRLRELEHAGTF